jgi:hypothetical protein
MYKQRIHQWRLDKNRKGHEMRAIIRMANIRALDGKESSFRVRGKPVSVDEVLQYFKRKGLDRETLQDLNSSDSPTPSDIICFTPPLQPSPSLKVISNPEEFRHPAQEIENCQLSPPSSAAWSVYDHGGLEFSQVAALPPTKDIDTDVEGVAPGRWAATVLPAPHKNDNESSEHTAAKSAIQNVWIPLDILNGVELGLNSLIDGVVTSSCPEDPMTPDPTCYGPLHFSRSIVLAVAGLQKLSAEDDAKAPLHVSWFKLHKAFDSIKGFLQQENPYFFIVLVDLTLYLNGARHPELATMLVNFVANMSAIVLPPAHPLRIISAYLRTQGHLGLHIAKMIFRKLVAARGLANFSALIFLDRYCLMLSDQCRHDEAALLLQEGCTTSETLFGDTHPFTTHLRTSLASSLFQDDRCDEATQLFHNILMGFSGTTGCLSTTLQIYALFNEAMGDFDLADCCWRGAFDSLMTIPDPYERSLVQHNLMRLGGSALNSGQLERLSADLE